MITVIEVSAVSDNEGIIPFSGPPFRKALVSSLSSQDPLVARVVEMHSNKLIVTPLLRDKDYVTCGYQEEIVYPGVTYRGRVVILGEELVNPVKGWLYKKPTIKIGEVSFRVSGYSVTQKDVREFIQEKPCKNFRIRFKTPTCFRRATTPYCSLYPRMGQIVASAMRSWNQVAPDDLKIRDYRILTVWSDLSVVETGYNLCTTKPVEIGEGRGIVGFVGWVNYKVVDHPEWHAGSHEEMTTWMNTLLTFASYIGVGYLRRAGFGVISYEVKRS